MLILLFFVSIAAFALVSMAPLDPLQTNVGQAAKKCAKLIVIAKTAKTGKDSGQKDAYAAGSDGSVERDTFSS